ncbi:MAG: sulfotransferase [Alphaproteobacteria bacterium]|nr:sulfotransferase [Alphaproteobacteria bacterium]
MNTQQLTPVFLISLPRSGSTLLQKLLATSPEFATTSEPWIALPIAYMRRRSGVATEYWQDSSADALDDIASQLPGGEAEFQSIQSDMIRQVYARLSAGNTNARYFLDKTPRYYLITDFLSEAFPDARFIFLFRNPLDVVSSILSTWHKDTFSPHLRSNDIDIWRGPELMATGYAAQKKRSLRIDYETLVQNPQAVLDRVTNFLNLSEIPNDALDAFQKIEFEGRLGDPTGGTKYDGVAGHSVEKFKRSALNPYRKAFFKSYVKALPGSVIEAFQLNRKDLLAHISQAPSSTSGLLRDLVGINWYRLSKSVHQLHLAPGLSPLAKADRKGRQLG